jgi:hypothetical protein
MIGADPPLPSAEPVDAADPEDVRADPLDLGAERDEEAAQILHVRLARGVGDHGLPFGQYGRHEDVLRSGHGGFVEEDERAAQALRAHGVTTIHVDVRAELGERMNVGVESPAPDDVTSGRRHDRFAFASEQWPGEED